MTLRASGPLARRSVPGRLLGTPRRAVVRAGPLMPFGAALMLAGGGLAAADRIFGVSLAGQMAQHIVLMSVVAPFAAIGLVRGFRLATVHVAPSLVLAVACQVAVLYLWHLPATHALAMRAAWGMPAMHATLLIVGIGFWLAIIASLTLRRWQAVGALLATGKLFCLLGILLVFARRPLYASVGLADQQLAGLVMLGACPIVYVAAAFVITCRGIRGSAPAAIRSGLVASPPSTAGRG